LAVIIIVAACASKHTPQYNAAVVSNDFAHSLSTLQTEEYALFQSGEIGAKAHAQFKMAATEANKSGLQADVLIAQGDLKGALNQLQFAFQNLSNLPATALGIKDPTSQAAYQAALSATLAVLQVTIQGVQQQQKAGAK